MLRAASPGEILRAVLCLHKRCRPTARDAHGGSIHHIRLLSVLAGWLAITDKDYVEQQPRTEQETDMDYLLRTSEGSFYPLRFPPGQEPGDHVGSGTHVRVRLRAAPPRAARKLAAPAGLLGAGEADDVVSFTVLGGAAAMQQGGTSAEIKPRSSGSSGGGSGSSSKSISRITGRSQGAVTSVKAASLTSAAAGNLPDAEAGKEPGATQSPRTTWVGPRPVADRISIVVFLLDMCGLGDGPPATPSQVLDFILSGPTSLASYFSTCSYGTASVNAWDVQVLGPVTLPCSGVTRGMEWHVDNCRLTDYYGWMFYAEEWAAAQGIDISRYRHRVGLTPKGQASFMAPTTPNCTWTGMAIVGPFTPGQTYIDPGSYSYVWVSGDKWDQPHAWFHELGHNYNLRHAGTPANGMYADYSSAMGYCCINRCMNPPQNWQMGWGDLVAGSPGGGVRWSLAAGETVTLALLRQDLGRAHVVRQPPVVMPGNGCLDLLPLARLLLDVSCRPALLLLACGVVHACV